MGEKSFEIRKVNEREIWVGENRLYIGEDNILYETMVGKQDLETMIAIMGAHDKLKNLIEGKINIIVDINKADAAPSEARKFTQEKLMIGEHGKIALCGMQPVARVIASFLMGVSKKKDMRFFRTKEEALAWIKEDKK